MCAAAGLALGSVQQASAISLSSQSSPLRYARLGTAQLSSRGTPLDDAIVAKLETAQKGPAVIKVITVDGEGNDNKPTATTSPSSLAAGIQAPSGRWGQSAMYLPNQKMVLFAGGQVSDGTDVALTNDVFALNVSSITSNFTAGSDQPWQKLSTTGLPAHAFAANAVVSNDGSDQVMLFGGNVNNCSAAAGWTWNVSAGLNSSWSPIDVSSAPASSRKARAYAMKVPASLPGMPAQNSSIHGNAYMMIGGMDASKDCATLTRRSKSSITADLWTFPQATSADARTPQSIDLQSIPVDASKDEFSLVDYSTVSLPPSKVPRSGQSQPDRGSTMFLGGLTASNQLAPWDHFWVFDPWTWTWVKWSTQGEAPSGRRGHSSTLLKDGRVLVVGGMLANGTISDEAFLLDTKTEPATWSKVTYGDAQGSIKAPAKAYHSAVLVDDVLLMGFGATETSPASSNASSPSARSASSTSSLYYLDMSKPQSWTWSDSFEGLMAMRGIITASAPQSSGASQSATSAANAQASSAVAGADAAAQAAVNGANGAAAAAGIAAGQSAANAADGAAQSATNAANGAAQSASDAGTSSAQAGTNAGDAATTAANSAAQAAQQGATGATGATSGASQQQAGEAGESTGSAAPGDSSTAASSSPDSADSSSSQGASSGAANGSSNNDGQSASSSDSGASNASSSNDKGQAGTQAATASGNGDSAGTNEGAGGKSDAAQSSGGSSGAKPSVIVGSLVGAAALAAALGGLYAYKKRRDARKEGMSHYSDMEKNNSVGAPPVSMLWFNNLKRKSTVSGNERQDENDSSFTRPAGGAFSVARNLPKRPRQSKLSTPFIESLVRDDDDDLFGASRGPIPKATRTPNRDRYLDLDQTPVASPTGMANGAMFLSPHGGMSKEEQHQQQLHRLSSCESIGSDGNASHLSYPYLSAMHRPSYAQGASGTPMTGESESCFIPTATNNTPQVPNESPRHRMMEQRQRQGSYSNAAMSAAWSPEVAELKSAALAVLTPQFGRRSLDTIEGEEMDDEVATHVATRGGDGASTMGMVMDEERLTGNGPGLRRHSTNSPTVYPWAKASVGEQDRRSPAGPSGGFSTRAVSMPVSCADEEERVGSGNPRRGRRSQLRVVNRGFGEESDA